MCFLKCSRCQGCLYHRPGITDIICIGCVPAAARVVRLEIRPLAVVIERAGVLGVDQSRILLTHQFFHYRIHVIYAFIDEDFRVLFVGRLHANIAIVNMVYHVLASEIAANFYWVLPHLACHAAVKGDAVRFTRHNADEALPSLDSIVPSKSNGITFDCEPRLRGAGGSFG